MEILHNDIRIFYKLVIFQQKSSTVINREGESRFLQYFGNMRHNSSVPDAFTEVMKVANHSEL